MARLSQLLWLAEYPGLGREMQDENATESLTGQTVEFQKRTVCALLHAGETFVAAPLKERSRHFFKAPD